MPEDGARLKSFLFWYYEISYGLDGKRGKAEA